MKLNILLTSIAIGKRTLLESTQIVSSHLPKLFKGDPLVTENKFKNILNPISAISDVQFFLYTQSNTIPYILKIYDINNLHKSPFDSGRQTKIIIHGWVDSALNPISLCITKNYLKNNDYNVIIVNWFPLSITEYTVAVELTRLVGHNIGKMVKFLEAEGGLSLSDVHIMGSSLGAHVAGFAGAYTSGNIGRITGLDSARPLFEFPFLKRPEDRLDKSDALFVDTIHTCASIAGFLQPIGHADFYPNGGTITQPGCPIAISISCSHAWATILMLNSIIHPDGFAAVKCDSWENYKKGECSSNSGTNMGEYVDHNARGKYYLKTSPTVDFC